MVSLLVGVFLIYNTVSASVARRRVEIGTLRAMGATRGEIRALFLSEAALVRGEDPEIEAYLVPRDKKDGAPVPQDVALIAALDGLKAIRLSQRQAVVPVADPTEAPAQ